MATLKNRGKGSWQVTISGGYDEHNKQIRIYRTIRVDPSKTEAAQKKLVEKAAHEMEVDYGRHLLTDEKKIKISKVIDEYMAVHPMSAATKAWYESNLKRIRPALGNVYVQDITPRQIRQFYQDLAKAKAMTGRSKTGKLSGTSQLHHHRALSAIMGFALKSGYISVNPMEAVDAPRADTEETAFLDESDIAQFMEVMRNFPDIMWKTFFIMAIYTSCRPGELIGLNWKDIEGEVMYIRAGSYRIDGKTIRTNKPKTKSSQRCIVLAPEVLDLLKMLKKEQNEQKLKVGSCWPEESKDAVFTGDEGNRLDLSSPTQKWRKIQRKYGLKNVTLYALRHTGASLLINAGADVKEVSGRLGHSRTSTTLDRYTHLFEKAPRHTTDLISSTIEKAVENRKKAL